jgi:hypothetical protein
VCLGVCSGDQPLELGKVTVGFGERTTDAVKLFINGIEFDRVFRFFSFQIKLGIGVEPTKHKGYAIILNANTLRIDVFAAGQYRIVITG